MVIIHNHTHERARRAGLSVCSRPSAVHPPHAHGAASRRSRWGSNECPTPSPSLTPLSSQLSHAARPRPYPRTKVVRRDGRGQPLAPHQASLVCASNAPPSPPRHYPGMPSGRSLSSSAHHSPRAARRLRVRATLVSSLFLSRASLLSLHSSLPSARAPPQRDVHRVWTQAKRVCGARLCALRTYAASLCCVQYSAHAVAAGVKLSAFLVGEPVGIADAGMLFLLMA